MLTSCVPSTLCYKLCSDSWHEETQLRLCSDACEGLIFLLPFACTFSVHQMMLTIVHVLSRPAGAAAA